MIIINLTGGLGNQMFQYAFGKTIAIKHNTDLKLHFTNALLNTQRSYQLDIFNISSSVATNKDLKKLGIIQNRIVNRLQYLLDERYRIQFNKHIVTQKFPYCFDPKYLTIKDDSYIQGNWSDENYFIEIKDIIRKEFTSKKKLDEKNQKILKHIQETHSVSIHVRRGDYITNKANAQTFGFIGLHYYVNAIEKINKTVSNPVFFVFSDDILWCKANLTPLTNNIHYIDHNKGKDAYKDLLLMSACKHNIIANSTFSWWGGWLNTNSNKIVIKPD